MSRHLTTPARVFLVVGLGYLLLAQSALAIGDASDFGAVIWPAAGLTLGALVVLPTRLWVWALAAVALAELTSNLVAGFPAPATLGWTAGNVVEPLVGASLIRWSAPVIGRSTPMRRLGRFLLFGAVVAPIIGGTVLTAGSVAAGATIGATWSGYVINDALGILLVAPLIITRPEPHLRARWPEAVAVGTLLVLVTTGSYFLDTVGWSESLPYLVLPLLVWTALRFGIFGASCGVVVFTATAMWMTILGYGPFAVDATGPVSDASSLRLALVVVATSVLLLGALVDDLRRRDSVEAVLRHAATHDPLTDLPNRRALEQRLAEMLDRAAGRSEVVAVLLCDLDNFKVVNDGFGHHAGDDLLIEISDTLRSVLSSGATLARIGGDEFIVAATVSAPEALEPLTDAIRASVARPVNVGASGQIQPSFSIGIATSEVGDDPETLISKADAAMYRAKDAGRSRSYRFDESLRLELEDRLLIESEVNVALRREQLFCVYQPEVVLSSDELFSFEALVRWDHPTRGVLTPARFVPAMERSGRAAMLFERVLSCVLDQQTQWCRSSGIRPAVSINLSPLQLGDRATVDTIAAELERTGAPASSLWVEVTESALMSADAGGTLAALRSLGVRTAIDDFGTGWASMSRLADFEWDVLKIDQSFVAGLDDGTAPSEKIVAAMIALAHSLGTLVVAEGIETEQQLRRLLHLGCDIGQGYLISRPLDGTVAVEQLDGDGRWTPGLWGHVAEPGPTTERALGQRR